jgi:hypothetical protein
MGDTETQLMVALICAARILSGIILSKRRGTVVPLVSSGSEHGQRASA